MRSTSANQSRNPEVANTDSEDPRTTSPSSRMPRPILNPTPRQVLPHGLKTEPDNRQGRQHGYDKYLRQDVEYFTPDTETLDDKSSFPDAELAENPDAQRSIP